MLVEKTISKELSGNYELNIKAIATEYTAPSESDIITEEGQNFRVVNVEKERSFEETYINVRARHVGFDLEYIDVRKGKVTADFDRTNINIDEGYDGWQVNYQFKGTLQEHLTELFKFTSAFSVGTSIPTTDVQTVSVSEGSIFDNLKTILDRFNCGFEFDNTVVNAFEYQTLFENAPTAKFNYSENNINMSRNDTYDNVISHLYAEAVIVPTDGTEEYNYIYEVGSGYPEYSVDFGELETEVEVQSLADDYYNIRSNPQPEYSIDVAELKLLPAALTPGDISPASYDFSVGDMAQVTDSELGITNEEVVIVGYDYSLLDDDYQSTVRLGTLDKERLPQDFEVFKNELNNGVFRARTDAIDVKEMVSMTRDYIKENIFGGEIKDINSDLLKYAARHSLSYPAGLGWASSTFTGSGTFVGLDNIADGFNAFLSGTETVDSTILEVFDPERFVKEEAETKLYASDFETVMKFWVDTYIDISADVSLKINNLYETITGEVGSKSTATINDSPHVIYQRIEDMARFKGTWQTAVSSVINYAVQEAGNPTEIYTEIGGGRNGFVGAINELWQLSRDVGVSDVAADGTETDRIKNPKIYTSTEDPIDTKGDEGDIWLKYLVGDN